LVCKYATFDFYLQILFKKIIQDVQKAFL
jgi:hypothetical protein